MSSEDVKDGIQKYKDQQAFGAQLVVIPVFTGGPLNSWWWGLAAFIFIVIMLNIKYLRLVLCILLPFWFAVIGWWIGVNLVNSGIWATIVSSIIAFLVGYAVNIDEIKRLIIEYRTK